MTSPCRLIFISFYIGFTPRSGTDADAWGIGQLDTHVKAIITDVALKIHNMRIEDKLCLVGTGQT
jgi:hypothetical protein